MARKKYWVALGEHSAFTRDDHYLFQVFFTGQKNGSSYGLHPRFMEADDLESARAKLHAFVDERINHEIHMMKLDAASARVNEKREEVRARPRVEDGDVNQLSIGGAVNELPGPRSETEGLLNLEDLL
jgi:hypothetical protein